MTRVVIHSKVKVLPGPGRGPEGRMQMTKKLKELYTRYEEIIVYLIVGVMTTIVAWTAKFLANAVFFGNTMYPTPAQNLILSSINWTAGVIFAFFTNRRFVFKSHEPMAKEAPKFVLSRAATWILDIAAMQVFTLLNVHLVVGTFVTAVLVTIANYVFSKLFVFNKKSAGKAQDGKAKEQEG